MKKFLAIFCVFCVLIGGIFVYAEPNQEITVSADIILYGSNENVSAASYDDRFGGLNQTQINSLSDALFDCLYNMKSGINISSYGFYLHRGENGNLYADQNLINIYSEVVATYPYLFNSQNFTVKANSETLKISTLVPIYNVQTKEEYDAEVAFCKEHIESIIADMPKTLSDAEKVVYVQDFIAINFGYDTRLFSDDEETFNKTIYDMYGFFTEGVGVCQAYTSTFNAIMDALGIHSESVIDRTDNHIWNVVEIDGENYHLDCTHDDPIFATKSDSVGSDFKGIVRRTCLLLNDDEIKAVKGHSEFHTPLSLSDIVCDSDHFSNAAFRNIDTPLSYYNGYWYGAEASIPTVVYKVSRDFSTEEAIYTFDENYMIDLNKIKGSLLIGNCFYINTLFSVIRLNLDTLTATTLYTSTEQLSTVYYYGGGYIGVVKGSDFSNSADNKFRLKIGDINCDDSVNAMDLIPIINHILDRDDPYFSRTLADANFDGTVNLVDLIRIKRYLAGHITEI